MASNLGRNITTFATQQNSQHLKIPILNCNIFYYKLIFMVRLLKSSHMHQTPSRTNGSLLKNNRRSWWCNLHLNTILLQNACFPVTESLVTMEILFSVLLPCCVDFLAVGGVDCSALQQCPHNHSATSQVPKTKRSSQWYLKWWNSHLSWSPAHFVNDGLNNTVTTASWQEF